MLHDTFDRILCPSCGKPMPASSMKYNDGDDESYFEYHKCDCGCRFTVEVSVCDDGRLRPRNRDCLCIRNDATAMNSSAGGVPVPARQRAGAEPLGMACLL